MYSPDSIISRLMDSKMMKQSVHAMTLAEVEVLGKFSNMYI